MVDLLEKFQIDFDNRFFGLAIVKEDSKNRMPYYAAMKTCTRQEIDMWVKNWSAGNADLPIAFAYSMNKFLNICFNQPVKWDNRG